MSPAHDDPYDDEDGPQPGSVLEMEEGAAVWVMADRCATCVYRPGNLMNLMPGRLPQLTRENLERQSHLTCHSTLLYGTSTRLRPAVCRGFADLPAAPTRSLALRTGLLLNSIRFQQPDRPDSESMMMSLLHRMAITGLTMDIRNRYPFRVPPRSSGWEYTVWDITLRLQDRTLERDLTWGTPAVTPTVYEVVRLWLEEACTALSARDAAHWAALTAGQTLLEWDVHASYEAARTRGEELRAFLGGTRWTPWLEALLDERRTAAGGAALHERERGQEAPGGVVTVRQVLALHVERVSVAGWVVVKEGRYQVAGDRSGEWLTQWEEALERVRERYPREAVA